MLNEEASDATGPKKAKPRGRPFGQDNPPPGGSQMGRKLDRSGNRLLRDMKWVYSHPKKPVSGMRAVLQEQLRDNAKAFVAQMVTLERKQAEGPVTSGPVKDGTGAGKPVVDEGSQRVGELVDRLLDEWEAQNGKPASDGS